MLAEQPYTCPHCWQTSVIQLDLTAGSQRFVQDCEVCCNPMEFSYSTERGELVSFHYESAQE
jgi:hypothetical protein